VRIKDLAFAAAFGYNNYCFRGVAQFGSALDWGSRGRWFKSSRPDFYSSRLYGNLQGDHNVVVVALILFHQKGCFQCVVDFVCVNGVKRDFISLSICSPFLR
jgi:hypothetical protein